MKALVIVFIITLAAVCCSLYLWQAVRVNAGEAQKYADAIAEVSAGTARWLNLIHSSKAQQLELIAEEHEQIALHYRQPAPDDVLLAEHIARIQKDTDEQVSGLEAGRSIYAGQADDARQVALSVSGLAIIGLVALAFRFRQLWKAAPVPETP